MSQTATLTASRQENKFPPYAYTQTEDRKLPQANPIMPPLFDEPTTLRNFSSRVSWFRASFMISTPILAVYLALRTELQTKTLVWSILYYHITMFGITAGYHRYWSHKSYDCTKAVQVFLCLAGSASFQGSIHWWARGHRAHHRWTDTDKDPYAAPRGLFYSHFGWLLINRPYGRVGYADVLDLKRDPLVRLQHNNYLLFVVSMSFIFPMIVAGLGWGDWKGGFVFSGLCRLVFNQHAIFCVNSLAHYLGDTPFDDYHTPKNSWITAIVTNGEGYHNFHHQFPQDYRNAILWFQYDPTKWFIKGLSWLGQTSNLKTFSANEIKKGQVQMIEKQVNALKQDLHYGTPLSDLPFYTKEEFKKMVNVKNKKWVLLGGILYDVENFDHPGGSSYLAAGIGKDMTKSFNGGIYNHSNGARNLLSTMRVGVLKDAIDRSIIYSKPETLNQKCAEYDDSLEPEKNKSL